MEKRIRVTSSKRWSLIWLAGALSVLLVCAIGIAGCGGGNTVEPVPSPEAQRSELTTKRAVWASKNIRNYRYTLTFTRLESRARFEAEVKNGVSTSFRLVEAENYAESNVAQAQQEYGTVDLLFDAAVKRIQNSGGIAATLSYDNVLGFPDEIWTREEAQFSNATYPRYVVDSLTVTE